MADYGTFDPTSLLVGPCPKHRPVTFPGSQGVLTRGTVLGRVTATDKYVSSVRTASDGSEKPVAVVAADIDTGSADVVGPAYFAGDFAAELLKLDASWSIAQLQAAFRQNNIPIFARPVGANG